MGTAVLNPQDCLRDAFLPSGRLLSAQLPPSKMPTPNRSSRHNRAQSNRRKRSPNSDASSLSPQTRLNNNLVMGQVKILKRGEEIQIPTKKKELAKPANNHRRVVDVTETHPVTPPPPAPAPQLNGSVVGFYAGSGFFTSPPPSSLPLPVFLKKSVDMEATSDLCRLLNLVL